MSSMSMQAAKMAYGFVVAFNGESVLNLEAGIRTITGYEGELEEKQLSMFSSYSEVQNALSKINEKESIRKKKGVYYTPSDVVHFIVINTIKASLGSLSEDNIHELNIDIQSVDDFCLNKTVYEPTCGAGEFLLEAFETKLSMWEKAKGVIEKKDLENIVRTIFGNDINGYSYYCRRCCIDG